MHSTAARGLTVLALVALTSAVAHADAVSDQKKAYKAMGITIPHPPAMCNLLTKDEAARYLAKPVRDCESAGALAGCAYRAADGSNDGILVTRSPRSDWDPSPKYVKQYRAVHGVGEQAYTYYEEPLGYTARALGPKGVTDVLVSGKYSAETALALVRIAMTR